MDLCRRTALCLSLALWLAGPAAQGQPPPSGEAASPAAEAPLAGYTDGGFFLRSPGGNFVLYPGGRLNVDGFLFPNRGEPPTGPPPGGPPPSAISPDSPADQRPRHQIVLRRARAELGGTLFKRFDFFLSGEFAQDPNPLFAQQAMIVDLWVNANFTPWANVMAGQFDAPFSLENRTPDKFLDFMERSLAVRALGAPTNKESGLMVWGLAPSRFLHYTVGLFNGDGPNVRNVDSRFDLIGRATFSPLALLPGVQQSRWLQDLWLGGSFWWGQRAAAPYPMVPLTTQGGVTLMPPLFSLGGQTYNLGPNGEVLKWALELNAPVGPFGLRFELVRIEQEDLSLYDKPPTTWDRAPLGHVRRSGTSFYLQAWYWILGDPYLLPPPGLQVPRRWTGYKEEGQWKLGLYLSAKYERLLLSVTDLDEGPVELEAKRAVLGHLSVDSGELGVNLWLARQLRLTVNYIVNYLDGDMRLIQGGVKFPAILPLVQPTYTFYRTAQHELLLRAAVAL
ncbi:MAG: porin [Myxococcales bacterium]|nr:OprO/OprP family phosphate-selective porin [Myxococcota bacterium]MDW8283404.1 porin [Myxococcales bacterium]